MSALSRFVRGLTRDPRHAAGAPPLTKSYEAVHLLAALRREGCPICHDLGDHDRGYFFWFFNENYFEAHTLDGLTRSWGFCRGHAATLTRKVGGVYQLAAVYRVLVARLRAALGHIASPPSRAQPLAVTLQTTGLCPPCRSRHDVAERGVFWMARFLGDPEHMDGYAQPGLLCFPHLQETIPRIPRPILERLLVLHGDAMMSAFKSLNGSPVGPKASAERSGDVEGAAGRAVRLAVGDQSAVGFPSLGHAGANPGTQDPIADLLDVMSRGSGCPVCHAARRAWIEWVRWLDGALAKEEVVDDLLPICPEHVSAFVQIDSRALTAATASHALALALGLIEQASNTLRSPAPAYPGRPIGRLVEALAGPRQRERQAREGLVRAQPCPVCLRLAVAEDRALSLLFALAGDRAHQPMVERGGGLCVRHFRRALALEPPKTVRRVLIEIEVATLARLEWELEEALRKTGWDCRPEAVGAEESAWRRAVIKFSGSLTEGD